MSRPALLTIAFLAGMAVVANCQQPCTPLEATPLRTSEFYDSTVNALRTHPHPYTDFIASITEVVAVRSGRECLTAFAYSEGWPRPFMGALFLLDAHGRFVDSFFGYASPTQLVPAGPNRLAFRSVDGEGAGVLEAHVRVLCSFGTSAWAECLEMPLIDRLWLMDGLGIERDGRFRVRAGILHIVRTGSWHLRQHGKELRGGRLQPESLSVRLP
ncbi:MAG: hypothetical protein ACHP7P_16370 [Terriglobales bacterium]